MEMKLELSMAMLQLSLDFQMGWLYEKYFEESMV